jgi:hypothetical protein
VLAIVYIYKKYISPLKVRNKPHDEDSEHVFILGSMDCMVANTTVTIFFHLPPLSNLDAAHASVYIIELGSKKTICISVYIFTSATYEYQNYSTKYLGFFLIVS